MTTKQRKYFSGNNLDSALLQAARHHGIRPEEVAYRQIEKRHGFLKARKGVLIEVDPESPQRTAQDEEPAVSITPEREVAIDESWASGTERNEEEVDTVVEERDFEQEQVPPSDPGREVEPDQAEQQEFVEVAGDEAPEEGDIEELIEAARRGLEEILSFAKLDLEFEVREGEDELEIELHGPDRARLLEDRGNLILSIQHLLPRLVRGYTGRSIPCNVDSENYHETRRLELKEIAEEAAAEVRHRQRSRTLPPMNPAERRIIHVTLADEKEVTTESQGRGFFKRVTISPALRRPRGFDRYSR